MTDMPRDLAEELTLIDISRAQRAAQLTAGEYRAAMLRARRWAMVCLDAGQTEEAKRQINEAARFSAAADEIEAERKAAA
jgi:hypothetical protein